MSATAAVPAIRYDLTYSGDVYPSYLANADPGGRGRQRAGAGHLAVRAGGRRRGLADNALESFSSRGPTIDGRVKPDLSATTGCPATSPT